MARSGPKGGRPRKWPADMEVKQVHFDVPADLAEKFKDAAKARSLTMADWLIAVGASAAGAPNPLTIQEALPLHDAA